MSEQNRIRRVVINLPIPGNLAVAAAVATWQAQFKCRILEAELSLGTTGATSGNTGVDVKKNGATVLPAVLSIVQVAVDLFSKDDRDRLLRQAITQRYSKDRPRAIASDVAGNATNIIALPVNGTEPFEENFSVVRSIEYPIGNIPPTVILDSRWQM